MIDTIHQLLVLGNRYKQIFAKAHEQIKVLIKYKDLLFYYF